MSTPLSGVAVAPRQLIAIQARRAASILFRALRKVGRLIRGVPQARTLRIVPSVRDIQELGDLVNRIAWYLPGGARAVEVPCPASVLNMCKNGSTLPVLPSQHRQFAEVPKTITLVTAGSRPGPRPDVVMLTRWTSLWRTALALDRVVMLDPSFYSTDESVAWATLHDRTLSPQERVDLDRLWRRNFTRFLEGLGGARRAYVFTTGPSLDQAMRFSYEADSAKVICNSIVKNRALLEHLRPQLLVFADPVFHFSPCVYASEFRRHALDTVREHRCYCVVPEKQASLLLAHYPELADRLIGMPIRPSRVWNFPSAEEFFVAETANIMTLFMVPFASVVAREVYIIGADGREKGERYFWRHSAQNQFDDLMQTVVDTHPSFFRDRVYTDYYAEHCRLVESQMRSGEARGVAYFSLTPSHIPALAARLAPGRTRSMPESSDGESA